MSVVCQGTWLLAQRLAIVSALPEAGAVIRVASIGDRELYHSIIKAYRGLGVALRTSVLLPDEPISFIRRKLPIFTDPMIRAVPAPTLQSSGRVHQSEVPPVYVEVSNPEADARRAAARARLAARAVERSIAKKALLATIDAIPMSGGIVVATNVRMKDYLHALLRTRRPAYALASVWFLVAGTEELERRHLGDVKLPVIRPPGVALNRTRAAKRAVVALSSNTPGA